MKNLLSILLISFILPILGCSEEEQVVTPKPLNYEDLQMIFSLPRSVPMDRDEVYLVYYLDRLFDNSFHFRLGRLYQNYLLLDFPNSIYEDSISLNIGFVDKSSLTSFRLPASKDDIYFDLRTAIETYPGGVVRHHTLRYFSNLKIRINLSKRLLEATFIVDRNNPSNFIDNPPFPQRIPYSVSSFFPELISIEHKLK